jgi:threonine aldolase
MDDHAAILDFLSDNVSPATPEVIAAVVQANDANAVPYGEDTWTAALQTVMAAAFDRECVTYPVTTGKTANALSLLSIAEPGALIFCHEYGHILYNELGGPAMYTGAELVGLPGEHGKIAPETFRAAIARYGTVPRGSVLNLTNATEAGTVYTPDEIARLTAIARGAGMTVHMDGARIANAIAHLGCHPADVTWRAGVDVLSFGATKNGGMGAEAIVCFDPAAAARLKEGRKRGGHVPSKMRFLSAQLLAYLADGAWLRRAAHANAMAAALVADLRDIPGVAIPVPVESNHVFLAVPQATREALVDAGYQFHLYERHGAGVIRLVTHWATTDDQIARFVATVRDAMLARTVAG